MPWLGTEGSALASLCFATVFGWLALGLGRRALVVLGVTTGASESAEVVTLEPIEKGVLALGMGAGLLQLVPLALGAAGAMTASALNIALALLCLAASPDAFHVAATALRVARGASASSAPGGAPKPDPWVIAWALALSPAIVMVGLGALGSSMDPDGLTYHLTVPKRWLESGRLHYLPTYPYSNSPMGMEMLFCFGLAFSGDAAAKCVHFILGVAATACIYAMGKRLRGPAVGAISATLFLVGPGGVAVLLGYSHVEGGAALAATGAGLAWVIWFQTRSRALLRVGAALAGIAVSFKITAALIPLLFFALTPLALAHSASIGAQAALVSTARLLPLSAIPMLPWLIRSMVLTGNPLFPLLASRIPSRDLAPDLAAKMDEYNRYMVWGTSVDWTLPQRKAALLAALVVCLLIGVVAYLRLRLPLARRVALALTAGALLQLVAAGLYIRYYLPVLGVFLVPALAPFASRLARPWSVRALVAFALIGSLVQARSSYRAQGADLTGSIRVLAGVEARQDYLHKHYALFPLYEYANGRLPADARILLAAGCGGFYLDRTTFCAEIVQSSLRYQDWDVFVSDLRNLQISHVIAPLSLAGNGPTPPVYGPGSVAAVTRADQFRVVRRLLNFHARELTRVADHGLYAIEPDSLVPPHASASTEHSHPR